MSEPRAPRLDAMTALPVPVPASLAAALGYQEGGDWLAAWWERAGDELTYSDGIVTFCGAHWPGWLAYIHHPRVAPHLVGWRLGSSDESALHALLLDLRGGRAYAGDRRDVERALRERWPQDEVPLAADDLVKVLDQLRDLVPEETSDAVERVEAQLARDQDAVERLVRDLDGRDP